MDTTHNPSVPSADDELNDLRCENEALRASILAFEKQERSFEALLAIISHEIKTPMGALIAMGELLQNTSLSEIQRHYVNTLLFAAETLSTTTKDIAYFAELKAGHLNFAPKEICFGAFLSSIALSVAPQAEAKGLIFRAEMSREVPKQIIIDPHRLTQIINNLMNNALKYTNEGFIELSVTAQPNSSGDHDIIIAIKDSGIGIPDNQMDQIFNPFFQASNVQQQREEGSGLGLWICRQIANGLNGNLSCESCEGEGSTFTLSFKAKKAPDHTKNSTPSGPENYVAHQPKEQATANKAAEQIFALKGRVLVVDDNKVNQMLMQVYLEKIGLEFAVASSGDEAIKMIGSSNYDLILMDILMPGLDGIACSQKMHALWGEAAKVPIIALSAGDNAALTERFKEAGITTYLDKPLNIEDLYQKLSLFLPQQETAQEEDEKRRA